jgi:hypothetical protein
MEGGVWRLRKKIKSYAERLNSFRKIGDLDLSFWEFWFPWIPTVGSSHHSHP